MATTSKRRNQVAAGLAALGYVQVVNPVKRYAVYRQPGSNLNWYLSDGGWLRIGHTLKDSRPVDAVEQARIREQVT